MIRYVPYVVDACRERMEELDHYVCMNDRSGLYKMECRGINFPEGCPVTIGGDLVFQYKNNRVTRGVK